MSDLQPLKAGCRIICKNFLDFLGVNGMLVRHGYKTRHYLNIDNKHTVVIEEVPDGRHDENI